MSGSIFVCDARGTPLMPMSPAYARRLLLQGKATRLPHHAFTTIQLTQTVEHPVLRDVTLHVAIHLRTADLRLIVATPKKMVSLLQIVVDLRTDLPWRLRRRAAHRRRRHSRQRYRPAQRFGRAFALRRPALAKSRWQRSIRRYRQTIPSRRTLQATPTFRWRAQAIIRVVDILRSLIPIAQIVLDNPRGGWLPHNSAHSAERLRAYLIERDGQRGTDGRYHAVCAYCGAAGPALEIDHLVPQSRGGTDALHNIVLACTTCNARKGNRTPAEAGMPLRFTALQKEQSIHRAAAYARRTAHALFAILIHRQLAVIWSKTAEDAIDDDVAEEVVDERLHAPLFVAYPVRHPRKQQFTARNYPLTTAPSSMFVRVGQTIKRRVQVNAGLAFWKADGHIQTQVIRHGGSFPADAQQARIGMLCEGCRAGKYILGIIVAVHSTGRLTLLVPSEVQSGAVFWARIAISPRQHLRIISTDRVIFMSIARGDTQSFQA